MKSDLIKMHYMHAWNSQTKSELKKNFSHIHTLTHSILICFEIVSISFYNEIVKRKKVNCLNMHTMQLYGIQIQIKHTFECLCRCNHIYSLFFFKKNFDSLWISHHTSQSYSFPSPLILSQKSQRMLSLQLQSSETMSYKNTLKCILPRLENTQNDTAMLCECTTPYAQALGHGHCSGLS